MTDLCERDERRLRVFISYSRKDLSAVSQLRDELDLAGFEAYLDLHDILPGEPWQQRLSKLIEAADTLIFVLSPNSVVSEIVDWEINEAERLAKRILPIAICETPSEQIPGRIKRLNYIFMRSPAEWPIGFQKLAEALRLNITWLREHTRLGELAAEWVRTDRADELLLRGAPLTAAERWISERPREASEPTELLLEFFRASREGEESRLAREEARLAEVADAQARTRRAQRRVFGVLLLMLVGVVSGLW